MKILVLSDSHSYYSFLEDILKRERSADMIIHLGDFADDLNLMNEYTALKPTVICKGNCDLRTTDYEEQHIFDFAGKKFLCCHGHRYNVKSGLYSLYSAARENKADICLFGHTHTAQTEEENGILLLNPGAVCNGEYAVIEIDGEKITVKQKSV